MYGITRTPIECLLAGSGPPAIAGLIISGIIRVSVDRVFRGRPRPHICKEVFKDFPAGAYLYANVPFSLVGVWILAAAPHSKPDGIFRKGRAAPARTALPKAPFKVVGARDMLVTAIASDGPSPIEISVTWRGSDNRLTTKF